ncbi:MAG: thioredoxin [Phycisphaera sp.]|nr:MAG: thioredoxin [Phycisphaera sp.]
MLNQLTKVSIVAFGLGAGAAFAEPEVFSDAGFKADQEAAVASGKVQIAYFTATWCPPCKKMKAETWVDEEIESWADSYAVITPVDVDRYGSLAAQYRARSIPTIVFIVGDKEVARTVGYQSPSRFIDWLEDTRTEFAADLTPAGMKSGGDSTEAEDAPAPARVEMSAGEVMREYNVQVKKDQSSFGMTGSVLLPRIEELTESSSQFKAEIVERVTKLQQSLESNQLNPTTLREYLQLAPIAGMTDQAVAWIEAQLATPAGQSILSKNRMLVQNLLTDAGRYDLASEFIGEPVQQARKMISAASRSSVTQLRDLEGAALNEFKAGQAALLDRSLADLIAIAQASGDDAKAKVIAKLFGEDTSSAQEAVNAAAERAGVEPLTIE